MFQHPRVLTINDSYVRPIWCTAGFTADAPNPLWVADFTYVASWARRRPHSLTGNGGLLLIRYSSQRPCSGQRRGSRV